MTFPVFTMRQLLESGVHFGHHTRRWNPKMKPYLYGVRNDIHIINLQLTVPLLHQALVAVREVAARGGRVLFVGTKRQAQMQIAEAAAKCGQYYVNHRWLGGMLTNWKTVSNSIKRLKEVQDLLDKDLGGITKKERLNLSREMERLERSLGGIKDMGGLPDIVITIDTNREGLAIKEANTLGIPVVAVLDSNSDPKGITYPIPGNDDSLRAIEMYTQLFSEAVLDGIRAEMNASGVDFGDLDSSTSGMSKSSKGAKKGGGKAAAKADSDNAAVADGVAAEGVAETEAAEAEAAA